MTIESTLTTELTHERLARSVLATPELDLATASGTRSLAAWFLGPLAENQDVLRALADIVIERHCAERRSFYPNDPPYVTEAIKDSADYKSTVDALRDELLRLVDRLSGSVPFFSYRYQAHMNWDTTLPAMLGYFAGMLYNQNNVALEASPVTMNLEQEVGKDLCRLLGYDVQGSPKPWGHITCDGTVANLEALWSMRNLKYYPIAVAEAIRTQASLRPAKELTVQRAGGQVARLLDLAPWECVNLPVDEALALTGRMVEKGVTSDDLKLINQFTLQNMGYEAFHRRYLKGKVGDPVVLATATMHYSWPKAAALLGLGRDNLIPVAVDVDARAMVDDLRTKLTRFAKERRPVIASVVVLGSTEQSAVDPLKDMLRLREKFHRQNLSYPIHVDAAWGGYFAAVRRPRPSASDGHPLRLTPDLVMSAYVNDQYESLSHADSITIDPHKAGFVPYPAGGLCYRNEAQKSLIAFSAPYIDQGSAISNMGLFGVEGSKPGAAAAGVYLSHRVITADQNGYGKILGQALFNSKRLYAAIVTLGLDHQEFSVIPSQRLPVERRYPGDAMKLAEQLRFIKERIVDKSNEELLQDEEATNLLTELGSDQIIIGYLFNARSNKDLAKANKINQRIAEKLRIPPEAMAQEGMPEPSARPPLILSGSTFDPALYGQPFMKSLMDRLEVAGDPAKDGVNYLISCTMDPWVTDTERGDFFRELRTLLADTVLEVIHETREES